MHGHGLLNAFTLNTSASTLPKESTLTQESIATTAIEQKFFEIVISKTESLDFPNAIWYSSGGYSEYLHICSIKTDCGMEHIVTIY